MVLLLFFCSGATALVYEVLWSKYLSLMVGTTVHAQTLVLGVFMGGLALGNSLFGRSSKALKQPLLAYGYMELGIALYAAAFDWLFQLADGLFVSVGSGLVGHASILLLIKGILSVCLLLIPTVLMGGTLPMLAAWLQQNRSDSGRLTARFYSVNTLGAVCGAALAGFYLIKTLGLVPTALIAGLVNAAVGTIAIGLARRQLATAPRTAEPSPVTQAPPRFLLWSAALVAVTGGVSMGLEILASRAFALIFGSSLQAFALVLIAFILGIGFGSAAIASPRLRPTNIQRLVVGLLLFAAVWVGVLVFHIESWMEFYGWTKVGMARNETGYVYHQLLTAVMALVVLGIPAAVIGAVLPLLMRAVSESAVFLGAEVGRLLTWNTLGAVVGVLLTGFVLMPVLGLRNAFVALASALAVVAVAQAAASRQRIITPFSAMVAAGVIALFFTGGERWKLVFSSGIYRSRETVYDPNLMEKRARYIRLLLYKDAADATITVEESVERPGHLFLRVNGKTDASSHGDYATQVLMAHLPLMARPDAKDVFVLGLGSGITAGAVLTHPVERMIVAENCRPMITAASLFNKFNNGVLTNSKARIVNEDGRALLKLSAQKYDIIISEPSNPWTVGSSGIFSSEFYGIAANRLKEDGIMAQWFHVYEMDDATISMVLRTFCFVFPYVEIWDAGAGDLILLGRREPWQVPFENYERVLQRPAAREQLDKIGLRTVAQILTRQLASQRTGFAIAGDGMVQSDYLPILEYVAPRSFFIGRRASLLKTYDERTIQWPLIPEQKYAILASLDDDSVIGAFTNRASVNPELVELLNWRGRGYSEPFPTASTVPSVFRGTNAPLQLPGEHANDPVLKELENAVERLRHRPANRREVVQQVQEFLQKAGQSLLSTNAESAAYYARIAARHAVGYGDYAAATQLLEVGLTADPTDEQLHYLARILEREQAGGRAMAGTQ